MIFTSAAGIGDWVESLTTPVKLREPTCARMGANTRINTTAAATRRNMAKNDCIMLLIILRFLQLFLGNETEGRRVSNYNSAAWNDHGSALEEQGNR